jgi:hypothetical protein
MTATSETPQPRIKTGQYTFAEHSEADLVLRPPSGLKFTADFAEGMIPEHKAALDHWHGRLKDAGVAGEVTVLSIDGADTDAGGPTVAGEWSTPEGYKFGFAVDHKALELDRYDQWSIDDNHGEESAGLIKGDGKMTDEDLAQAFSRARARARTAGGWAARSMVRSTERFRFGLPELAEDDQGRQVGRITVDTPIGDYRVDLDRGAFTARVYGPEGNLADASLTRSFFRHVSQECGGSGDYEDLKYGMLHALEAGTDQPW